MSTCIAFEAEIIEGRRGHLTARVLGETTEEIYLHSAYDPVTEAAALVPGPVKASTLVFLGTGLGYHIPLTLNENPQVVRVILVEIYPSLAALAAHGCACSGITVDIVTSSGDQPGAPPDLPADLDARDLFVVSHPPSVRANPTWYSRIHAKVTTCGSKAWWLGSGSRECRTILVPFGAYYAENECIRGFQSLGHHVIPFEYRRSEEEILRSFREILLDTPPDLVFSVNMRGMDGRGIMAGIMSELQLPVAFWFVDSPEFILPHSHLPSKEICSIFMWDRSYISETASRGFNTTYLPLAADADLGGAAVLKQAFQAPLAFVGNSLASGFLARLVSKFPINGETEHMAEQAISRLIGCRGRQLEVLEELATGRESFKDPEQNLFWRAYLLHGATTVYRTAVLQKLLPYDLVFFGDPEGWQKIFGGKIDARPDVNYFHELPCVYRSSDITVNVTSFQMPRAVNQRVFDVPVCGGFLLTDRQEALFEIFDEDEIAVYDSHEDVTHRMEYYRRKPLLRQSMMEKACRRVKTEHTYRHRMKQVLEEVFR
ncbi:glycosyltransferase [Geobacter sp. DSM 9736]|uniref:glycosyltransferase family protein n=1 Tax=Geobacter sp. DSM 9736 TaxID=1277350 RepID=UPI000B4FF354|nr:glycosyltransferase [Geobacter sp. DSM 9736]SNB47022.1 spore maturation protein CgeB [Geobacter sp. DSM 9736]